jgi:hypothetical protein
MHKTINLETQYFLFEIIDMTCCNWCIIKVILVVVDLSDSNVALITINYVNNFKKKN